MKLTDRDALAAIPLFRDASREIAERLAIGAFVQTLPKGTLLFDQGQDAEFLHVILEGRCGLIGNRSDGEECVVEIMHAGDCFRTPKPAAGFPGRASSSLSSSGRSGGIRTHDPQSPRPYAKSFYINVIFRKCEAF
jgi:hypothetical protein